VTPTAVPSATAESQADLPYYNSCLPPYESMSGGAPYTGVCEREWVDGRYVCRHHARDFCKAILDNGSNQAMGSGCWVVGIGPDFPRKKSDLEKTLDCVAPECGLGAWKKQIRNPFRRAFSERTCPKEIKNCLTENIFGHAINIFRSGGQEVLDRYGEVTFSVVEPRSKDGSSAVLCSWRQKKLEPVIPLECKEKVAIAYFPGQVSCGLKYNLKVWDLDDWNAEVARQDKVDGFETSKP
jgi:hypothetical protein